VALDLDADEKEQQKATESAPTEHERATEREAERKAELSAEMLNMEVARRRNFAIISHPDAGKTTLVCQA
jgi:ABC-type polysaccharide/polyol phosphate transport system ATPase subunit